MWVSYVATIILLSLFGSLFVWFIKPNLKTTYASLISPLPDFLTITSNNQVSTIDLFLPFLKSPETKQPVLFNESKAVLSYDLSSGKTLFSKNPRLRLPMASLTKIMTAIVALENKKKDDRYYVSKKSLVGENSMGAGEGEFYSLEELLYGLMLVSGNDAAEILAENYSGGREKFIEAMNKKSKALGLFDTHYTNPSGLEGDGDQYTTAYDLLVTTRYALEHFSLLKTIVSTYEYHLPYTPSHKELWLYNETNLLTSYPGVKGVKDGYTPEAGLCLVTYLDYGEHQIIGVVLGSNNRRQEMKDLLDYSLRKLEISPPKHG